MRRDVATDEPEDIANAATFLASQQFGCAYGYRISTFLNFEFHANFHDLRAWNLKVCAGTLGVVMHECEKLFAPAC
jgi:hypothetical protein